MAGVAQEPDVRMVIAAQAGDRRVLNALVADQLPLIYSIVHRALWSDADADDVVQETMIRLVRGINGLRDPHRFRPWLVAIAMNQIRDHRARRSTAEAYLEEYEEQPDAQAEFVDRMLTRLNTQRQRREIEAAVEWLQPADRELLSLWLLECDGHLTRSDMATALRQEAHHVTVRVGRLKNRLEATRALLRALAAAPRCRALSKAARGWSGEANPLWRKRFLRHVGDCERCRTAGAGLVPVERLFMGAALLALPVGYSMRWATVAHGPAAPAADPAHLAAHRGELVGTAPTLAARPLARAAHRFGAVVAAKPIAAAASVAVVATIGLVSALVSAAPSSPSVAAVSVPVGRTHPSGTDTAATVTASSATSSSATWAAATTSPATPRTTTVPPRPRTATSNQDAEPTSATPRPGPSAKSGRRTAAPRPAPSTDQDRLLVLLNERRRALGLPEVNEDPVLVQAAQDCARRNLLIKGMSHCGHEVLLKGHKDMTPEQMIEIWFASKGHRAALTYPTSRNAGAAIAIDANGVLVAAITIDY